MSHGSRNTLDDRIRESLKDLRSKDVESNRISTPPPGERLRWGGFWLIDFVTPEVLPETVEHLRSSPLDRGEVPGTSEPLSSWLGGARLAPLYGGWADLAICARPGAGWAPMVPCEDIPKDVDTITLSLMSLTPGLQAVVALFRLTEGGQRALEDVLVEPRSTEAVEQANGTITFREPIHQKSDDFRLVRQTIHAGAGQWLAHHIPGILVTKAQDHSAMPSCDFIVTRNRVPFPQRYDRRRVAADFNDFMHAAGLDMSFETWQSAALPGFRLGLPEGQQTDPRMLTLAARERSINDFAERMYGDDFFGRTTDKLHDVIRDLLITWSLHGLAQQYHAQLSEHRDSSKRSASAGVEGAIDRAKEAKTVMGEVADARVIARDLAQVTEPDHWLQREPLTFRQVVPALRRYHDAELHAALTDVVRREAHALDVLSSDLEASTVAGSNLDVARASLSLQQRVNGLTVVLVILTVVLVAMTAVLGYLAYLALK